MKGRPTTTKARKELGGSRERAAHVDDSEFDIGGIQPPYDIEPYALEVWEYYAPKLELAGTLALVDREIFLAFCVESGKSRQYDELINGASQIVPTSAVTTNGQGSPMEHPYSAMRRKSTAATVKYAEQLGLTPITRSKVSDSGENIKDDDNPFAAFN